MCSLLALLSCFSMNGFYVDAQIIHSNKGAAVVVQETKEQQVYIKEWNQHVTAVYPTNTIQDNPRNPYGRLSVGYDVTFNQHVSMRLDYSHESSLDTNADRGEERISLGITWRPFR